MISRSYKKQGIGHKTTKYLFDFFNFAYPSYLYLMINEINKICYIKFYIINLLLLLTENYKIKLFL